MLWNDLVFYRKLCALHKKKWFCVCPFAAAAPLSSSFRLFFYLKYKNIFRLFTQPPRQASSAVAVVVIAVYLAPASAQFFLLFGLFPCAFCQTLTHAMCVGAYEWFFSTVWFFFPLPVRFVNAGKHKTSNVNWKSFVCETECVISWSVYHFLQLLARACFKKFDSFPLFCSFLFLFVWRVNLSLNFWREVRGLGARRRGLVVCRTPRQALTVQCFVKSFISDSKTHEAHVASSSRLQLQLLYFSVWVSNFPFHVNMNAKYLSVNNSGSSTQCLSYGSLKW